MDQQYYELEIRRIQSKEPKAILAELVTDVVDLRQRFDLIERKIVAMKAYEAETARRDNAWVESFLSSPKILRLTKETLIAYAKCADCGKSVIEGHEPVNGATIVYMPEDDGKIYCETCFAGTVMFTLPSHTTFIPQNKDGSIDLPPTSPANH